jgi:diguanylate cyclase (GGDEF)-like protein
MLAGVEGSERPRRGSWTDSFDAALSGLATHRPLPETVGQLLDATIHVIGTEHGFVSLGTDDAPGLRVRAGRGMWATATPDHLDALARRTGAAQAWTAGPDDVHRYLVAPVKVDEGPVGSIGVALPGALAAGDAGSGGAPRDVARPPTTDQLDLLARFAALVAVAYSGARLITTERAAREQEKALIRSGQALSATLDLQHVFHRILSELRNVVPYDTASVQELRGDQMVIVGGHGIDMDVFAGVGFDVAGDGVPNADVARRGVPVIVTDILGDHPYPNFPHDAHEMSGVRGWLGVPLLFGRRCIGMITLDTYAPDFYTEEHADTAMAFAAQAAIALQNARSFDLAQREVAERRRAEEELRQANADLRVRMGEIEALQADLRVQAERDALTGLYNRRYLIEVLPSEVKRSELAGRPLVVVMVDVDNFKEVNDSHGHAAGDAVLVAVGELLADQIRPGDVACRYGGEEFVLVLPGVDVDTALVRAENWRRHVAGARLGDGAGPGVTMSLGVAEMRPGEEAEELIRRADAAMYSAKAAGRNRVVAAG